MLLVFVILIREVAATAVDRLVCIAPIKDAGEQTRFADLGEARDKAPAPGGSSNQ